MTIILLYGRIVKYYYIGVVWMVTNGGFLVTKIKQLGDRILNFLNI